MTVSKKLRALVIQRAHGYCEYCLCPQDHSPSSFSIEHIIPESRGGPTEEANLAWSCQGCNNAKYNHVTGIDSVTGAAVALFNPRKDNWRDHFRWEIPFSILIGVSGVGRATIRRLKLNRENIVNLRRTLVMVGKHPPEHLNWVSSN
ncbi:MAG: hypothetical protein ACI8UO_001865 [Verrucomicrobiales bacterium]|jgi:hypothetical protein